MSVCKNCSTDFDGEVCPKCGQKHINVGEAVQKYDKPFLCYFYGNLKLRVAAFMFCFCSLIVSVVLAACLIAFVVNGTRSLISPHLIIIIGSAITVVVALWSLIADDIKWWTPRAFLRLVQKKKNNNKRKLDIIATVLYAVPLAIMLISYIVFAAKHLSVYGRGYIMSTVYVVVSAIVFAVAKIGISIHSDGIAKYLYGSIAPAPDATLVAEYDEARELEAYKAYIAAKKNKNVIYKSAPNANAKLSRIFIASACAVFAVVTAVSAAVSPLLVDKFSASFLSGVSKTALANSQVNVQALFGDPNEKSRSESGAIALLYYDDEYAKLKTRMEEVQKQLENATEVEEVEQITELLQTLNKQAAKLEFTSLIIQGTNDSEDNLTSVDIKSITLNTKTKIGLNLSQKKTVKRIKLLEYCIILETDVGSVYTVSTSVALGNYISDGTFEGFNVEMFYSDGSYKLTHVSAAELIGVDFDKRGKQTVKWSDEWGDYSATLTL